MGWWPTPDGTAIATTAHAGASVPSAERTAETFAGFVEPIAARMNGSVTRRAYGWLAVATIAR